jgi:organic radical activating enzyme
MRKSAVFWELSRYCTFDCLYCPSSQKNGSIDQPTENYRRTVNLLQDALYSHVDQINWVIRGGDPLIFPNIGSLISTMKSKPSRVEFNTSGGDNWFDLMSIIDNIDYIKLTIHYWQNPSVTNFILDHSRTTLITKGEIFVPLYPGKIIESRDYIKELKASGFRVSEQILRDSNFLNYWEGYSQSDINLIEGRQADQDPVKYEIKYDIKQSEPVIPDSTYVDLSVPPADDSPSYTGKTCYAGIDYLEIDHKGFVSGSKCRGRTMGNIFEEGWKPEYQPFACPMLFCREIEDRRQIRVVQ